MARISIKATCALDAETADTLESMAGAALATPNADDLARFSAASLTIVGVRSTG